jgi:PAS domain S-box-containing protein
MRNQPTKFGRFTAQLLFGGIALALVTLASLYFPVHFAATAFAYLIVMLLFSLMGSFIASAVLSVLCVAALAYFFAAPAFSPRIDDPQNLAVVVAFFVASIAGARLIENVRQQREAALEAEAKLRQSQVELRNSEREWREVFEHNPVMYFMVDSAGIVLNVNTFGATQLGYSVAELVGKSVLNVFFAEEREFVRKSVGICLETLGQSHTWEIRKVRKDGSTLWVRENAKAMRRADHKPVILIACEDITERKRAEKALQQNEAYQAQAQALSGTGSFGWNVATGEIIWSKQMFRIFQCEQPTKPSMALFVQLAHPEDRAAVRETIDQACRDGKDFEHQYGLLLPDGTVKHVHALARARKTDSGGIEFAGAITDVTRAKQAEQKLRRSEAYLAEAQRLSHTGSWSWDVRRSEFVYRSAEVYRLFGFDPEEDVSAEAIQSRIPADDLRRIGEVLQRAMQKKGGQFEFDFRILLPDGATRHVHSIAHAVVGNDGDVSEIIGTHMDVTEQHAARERLENAFAALRESEQRFRDYAETASDWLWETGPDHRVTHLSEHTGTADILVSSVTGVPRWELASDVEAEPEKWRQHQTLLDAHLPFRDFVYRTTNRMGYPIYIRTSGKPVLDASGKFLGYRGISTDITATIRAEQAEQALREARAELAHVTRVTTLGELTASIAHEVSQPLAAVIANAEASLSWLDRTPPDLDAARRSAEWIVDDANRASEVIRRVRALAKKTDIEKASLSLNEIVGEAVALVQRELASHEVALRMDLAPNLPRIFGDRVQLQQVIINLVINSIEALQSVTDRPRELKIQTDQDDARRVCLTVTDNGVGLAAEDAERMFTPFFTTKSSGMGMGLSICRSIIEAHEGRLSASRHEGHGATFQFVLPLHQEGAS